MKKEQKTIATLDLALDEEKYLVNLGQYEIFFENGETYFVKKKPTYPKTYEECCELLNVPKCARTVYIDDPDEGMTGYENSSLILGFRKLLICRDAYWKVVGDKMGLGKPWSPDWASSDEYKSVILTINDKTCFDVALLRNHVLAFPEKTICEDFYHNFKHLIEECKEFL